MKKLLIITLCVAISALCGGAIAKVFAADLPTKAPSASYAAPLFSWTGFWVGGHATGAWENVDHESLTFANGNPSGWGGGAQLRAWYEFPNHKFVLGATVDIDALDVNGKIASGAANIKANLQGTIRANLGYSIASGWLPYITGGIYGAKHDVTIVTFKSTDTIYGWVAGGGLEIAIDPHWSLYGEYLYLGDSGGNFPIGGFSIPAKINAQQAKFGINLKM